MVGLTEKLATETGSDAMLPPPPQDEENRAIAIQAVARITAVPRLSLIAPISMTQRSLAHTQTNYLYSKWMSRVLRYFVRKYDFFK